MKTPPTQLCSFLERRFQRGATIGYFLPSFMMMTYDRLIEFLKQFQHLQIFPLGGKSRSVLQWSFALWVNLPVTMSYDVCWLSSKESACQFRRHKRCEFDILVRKIPCGRKWQLTLVLLPGKFHGQSSLVGYCPWGHKALDRTEQLTQTHTLSFTPIHSRLG